MINKIKNNQFARNSLILFTGTMVGNAIGYVFHFVIGRMVSVPVYGEVESLISLVAIISVPAGALTLVATKFSANTKAEDDQAGSHEIFNYLNKKIIKYGLPLFILAVLVSPLVRDYLKIESIWPVIIVWLMMFLSFFAAVAGGILNGWQKFKDSSLAGIWGAVAKLATAIIFVKIGFAAGGVVSGFALGTLATYVFFLYYLKVILKNKIKAGDYISKIDFSSIKKYIIPVFVGNLAIIILSNADMILAKHSLSPELAGQYGALTIVSKIIFFGTGIIATVLFSMSAEEHHKNNYSTKTFKQALLLMSVLGLLAVLFYALFPKFILFMLFGSRYLEMSHYLIWFAVSVTLFSFLNLIFQYLLSIHKTQIAYFLLVVSIFMVLSIELFGTSISAIIGITAFAQILGILAGAYLLLTGFRGAKTYE
jgi:O-antigen/teichoic acid export membrane protein